MRHLKFLSRGEVLVSRFPQEGGVLAIGSSRSVRHRAGYQLRGPEEGTPQTMMFILAYVLYILPQ